MADPNTAEAERLFSLLTMAAGEDADRDLYYDETAGAWDLEGLRSDLALYSPQAAAEPVSELFAAPATTPQAPPQMSAPPQMQAPPQPQMAAPPQMQPPPQMHSPPPTQQVWAPPAQSPQPASGFGEAPPPALAVASPAPFQSPEPSFEQMMASATPLNVAAPATAAPPAPLSPPFGSGGSMAPPASRDSSTSWQTVGAGMLSPPACGMEGEAAESEEKPAQPQGQGGWLVNLVEGGQMPSLSGLTTGLSSWVGGFQRTEAAPRSAEPSFVYNAEVGAWIPSNMTPEQWLEQERLEQEAAAQAIPPPPTGPMAGPPPTGPPPVGPPPVGMERSPPVAGGGAPFSSPTPGPGRILAPPPTPFSPEFASPAARGAGQPPPPAMGQAPPMTGPPGGSGGPPPGGASGGRRKLSPADHYRAQAGI